MWNISMHGLFHLGVVIMVDVLFHFMYILTIPTDMKLLKRLSDWALSLCRLPVKPYICDLILRFVTFIVCFQWA